VSGESLGSSSRFWPANYQERGVAIPFTTPAIAFSRVRTHGREGLESLIPGLSGGQGVYVIPWKGLRQMFKLTVHDRALHEEIQALKDATPRQIRDIALNVSASGLAGPKTAEAARTALDEEAHDKLRAGFFLITAVVERLSGEQFKITLNDVATEAGQREVREALNRIARQINVPAAAMHERMDAWAMALGSVGVPNMPKRCRVRRKLDEMQTFSDTMRIWSDQTFTPNKDIGKTTSRVAMETLARTRAYLTGLDRFVDMAGETPVNWDRAEPTIIALAEKSEWLLDGWSNLVALWDASVGDPPLLLDRIVGEIFRLLPLVPRDELDAEHAEVWSEFERLIAMSQRNVELGGASDIDLDRMLRLEMTRAKSLG